MGINTNNDVNSTYIEIKKNSNPPYYQITTLKKEFNGVEDLKYGFFIQIAE